MRAVLVADSLRTGTHDVMRTGGRKVDGVRSGISGATKVTKNEQNNFRDHSICVDLISLSVVVLKKQTLQLAERRLAG